MMRAPDDRSERDSNYWTLGVSMSLTAPDELKNLRDPGYSVEMSHIKGGAISKEVAKRSAPKWMVLASLVEPIHGKTRMKRVNLVTGEDAPESPDTGFAS